MPSTLRTERMLEVGLQNLLQRDPMGCYAAAMAAALTASGITTTTEQVDSKTNTFGGGQEALYRRTHAITALGCTAARLRITAGENTRWCLDYLRRQEPCSYEEYLEGIRSNNGEKIYNIFREGLSEKAYLASRDSERALDRRFGNKITRLFIPRTPTAATIAREIDRGPVIFYMSTNNIDVHAVVCVQRRDRTTWHTFDPASRPGFLVMSDKDINNTIRSDSHIVTVVR